MAKDLTSVLLSAVLATLNPSLLGAVTVMLILPHPRKLMLGYLLGAYTTSIIFGLVFVFSLHGSSAARTSQHTLSPAADVLVGAIAWVVAFALETGRSGPLGKWKARHKRAKAQAADGKEDWQTRMLARGSARVTFGLGVVLSFPGVSYLNALTHIVKLNSGTVPMVLLVVYFCVMQQALLELPLLGYLLAPERTQDTVTRFRAWLHRRGRLLAAIGLGAIGALLIVRGLITLLS